MVDRGGQAPLAEESLARVGRIEPVAQDLERHAASALQVLGFIDRAHAARAERADDGVMAKLLARLRQAAGLRPRPGQRHRAPGTRRPAGFPSRV